MKITYEFSDKEKEACRRCPGNAGQEKAEEIAAKERLPLEYDPDAVLALLVSAITPTQLRRAILHGCGMSTDEIAAIEDVEPRAVRQCLARAGRAIGLR